MNFEFLFLRLIQFVLQGYRVYRCHSERSGASPLWPKRNIGIMIQRNKINSVYLRMLFTLNETFLAKWHLQRFKKTFLLYVKIHPNVATPYLQGPWFWQTWIYISVWVHYNSNFIFLFEWFKRRWFCQNANRFSIISNYLPW